MMKNEIKKRGNYAFIDSQNLNLGVRSQGWRLDFGRFRTYLKNKYNVVQAFLFIGHIAGNEMLYTNLQKNGYLLIFKPTLEYKENEKVKIKGNVDAELVLHTMIELKSYEKAIIVSGDGDFHCLIEYLEQNDKLGRVLVPSGKYSSLLRKYQHYIVPISGLRKSLEKKMTKISGRSKS
ncbi:MAG: hypothetical protein UT34_C0002G0300 [candidate division WS6 bacterium GW2011_GWF2_39_15]|uniref:NYN domain-containing protein n=1 Tax=candidate division WS6 bacterium GW2011_GWF2_39_15 TaxID=1619100 RepID=A0A0G0MRK3_9BACT|nr:MAG: hypothetical protein UT34_C0002G0300 [candidate division WS6 bacterium GW2011_GWF2_39_15]